MGHTDTERWFIKRGVPHFIASYTAREDVLTRATPFLVVVFLFSAASAADLDWPAWGIALAVIAGLGLLLSAWMIINRARGRPRLARPDSIGGVEVAVFLFVPVALPLVFGGDLAGAGITFLTLLGLLLLAYIVTSYGLISLSLWAVRQTFRTLGQTARLFTRSLPLLLLGFMFLFINAEAWQAAGQLDRALLVVAGLVFAFLASLFLVTQIPREMDGLDQFGSWSDVTEWADDAPVAGVTPATGDAPSPPPLALRERGDVFLVFLVSQGLRLVLVSSLVGLFFVLLGLLVIQPETILLWIGEPPDVLIDLRVANTTFTLTEELLQVSAFLAAFAALYFSVYTTTDQTLRKDFFEDTVAELRQNLAVRALYRQSTP